MASGLESRGFDVVRDYSRAIGNAYNEWKATLGPDYPNSKSILKRGSALCKLIVFAIHENESLLTPPIDKSIPDIQVRFEIPQKPEFDSIKILNLESSHMHLSSVAQEIEQRSARHAELLEASIEAHLQYQPSEEPRVSATQTFNFDIIEKQIAWRIKMKQEMQKEMEALSLEN